MPYHQPCHLLYVNVNFHNGGSIEPFVRLGIKTIWSYQALDQANKYEFLML